MSRRKLSPKDWAALNGRAVVGIRYPPGGGRPELYVPTAREERRRKRRGKHAEQPTRTHEEGDA